MRKRDCNECTSQCWQKNTTYKIKNPFRAIEGEVFKTFNSVDDFWDWFFNISSHDPSCNPFDDFRLCGCWNWLIDDKDANYFNEIIMRIKATELHIPAVSNYDNAESRLLEHLIYAKSELEKANIAWQKKNSST